MPKTREQIALKKDVAAERRRTKRVPLTFQIEVSGRDPTGAPFRDRTVTSDVNENGCRFDLLWQLKPGDLVAIAVIPRNPSLAHEEKPTLFQVVWVEPSEMGWTIGATTLQHKNIWHMAFPTKK